jgi:hypothetical protein
MADAKRLYEETGKTGAFNLLHCWVILQHTSKWQELVTQDLEKAVEVVASASQLGDDASRDKQDGEEQSDKPIGRKAAKEAKKRNRNGLEKAVAEMVKNLEAMLELSRAKTETVQCMAQNAQSAAKDALMSKGLSSMDSNRREYYEHP